MKKEQVILGIDPGTQIMGYALLSVNQNKPSVICMDVLKLTGYKDIYKRLEKIHTQVCALINTYQPQSLAIEAPFFGKNVQSMLKLGRAQGVAIAAAMQHQLQVIEYAPKKVKVAISGNGNASKEQMWRMLQRLLAIRDQPKYFDATDALAVALCHYYQLQSPLAVATKKMKSWEDFIAKNPDRIKIKPSKS